MKKNPLLDDNFLKELSEDHNREIFIKIIALDYDENPIEEIQGRATSGSVSVDGSSASRRTCSITLAASEMNLHEYYWGLNTKFKLYVGQTNHINDEYEDIIWFPFGTYLISSFSTSQSTSSYSISIQGKDKMSQLNGELGGTITALTHDFGTIDEIAEDGSIQNTSLLIKDIIIEVVHEYAREPYHNIVINDLDEAAVELIEYRGDTPLYFFVNRTTDMMNATASPRWAEYYSDENCTQIFSFNEDTFVFDPRIELGLTNNIIPTIIYAKTDTGVQAYSVIKATYGETVGYRIADLTYAGDLIGQVGNSVVTACLDKIKSMLGDYEYFYNLEGQFVFQRKRTYVNVSWNNLISTDGEEYADNAAYTSAVTFSFDNSNVVTSYSNQPNFNELKNDFAVWGTRTSTSGSSIPVHMRYAIDKKPAYYKTIDDVVYYSKDYVLSDGETIVGHKVDWREIMYQMSVDYMQYNHDEDFLAKVAQNNSLLYPTGYTGYEQYYTDINSFWRDLYDLDYAAHGDYKVTYVTRSTFDSKKKDIYRYIQCQESDTFDSMKTYYIKTVTNGYVIKDELSERAFTEHPTYYYYIYNCSTDDSYNSEYTYYKYSNEEFYTEENTAEDEKDRIGWKKTIFTSPQTLNFWFDFLDTEGDLSQYQVRRIGLRSKSENNANVKSIYYRETPEVIFVNSDLSEEELQEQREQKQGYSFCQLPDYMENLFNISSQGKSAKDRIDELLYSNAYCTESITINTIPVYHLQPNTRIFVRDDNSGINGEYIINKITVPLSYNGTMSINATKAVERLY